MKIKTYETIRRGSSWERKTNIIERDDFQFDTDVMSDLFTTVAQIGVDYSSMKIEMNRDDRHNNIVITIHGNNHRVLLFDKSIKKTFVIVL